MRLQDWGRPEITVLAVETRDRNLPRVLTRNGRAYIEVARTSQGEVTDAVRED